MAGRAALSLTDECALIHTSTSSSAGESTGYSCLRTCSLPEAPHSTRICGIGLTTVFSAKGDMKTGAIALTLLLCFVRAPACLANNSNIGTWKLNESKSKLGPGAPKDHTVAYEAVDDSVKVTMDGVDKDGRLTHTEWTGKFDGKDYPVIGDPNSDARSYTRIDDRTLGFNIRKADYDIASGRIVVSADGKRCIVTASGKNSKGKKFSSVAVYDKQ